MKNKLFFKIIITLLIILFVVGMFNNFVYAEDGNFDLGGFDSGADASITGPTETIVGAIIGVLRIVCTGIAVIMIIMVAVKYLLAAPGERADLKKSSVQYIVGAVILFGSAGIFNILEGVVTRTLN